MTAVFAPFIRFWQKAERSRAMTPMLVSVGVICIANSVITTAVSLHLSAPELSAQAIQAVLTAYPLGFLIGCLVTRPLVARFRHEWAFVIVTVVGVLGAFGLSFTDFIPAWIGFRLAGGLAIAALFVICESWINLYASQQNRGTYFSIYMLTTTVAQLFGQLLVGAAGANSPYLFVMGSTLLLAGVALKFVCGPWPALPDATSEAGRVAMPGADRYSLLQLLKLAPVTVVSIFQAGVTNLNMFVLTPIYGAKIGLSASTTVGLITTLSIAGVLAQTPVGWLSDRFDRRLILLVQGLLSISLCAAIAWLGAASEPMLFVLFFLYGATALTIYPVAIAFANSQLHSRYMVAASGTLFLLYSVSNTLTPGLAAGLMERTAPQAMFFVLGAGAVLVTIAACFNLLRPSVQPARDCVTCGANE